MRYEAGFITFHAPAHVFAGEKFHVHATANIGKPEGGTRRAALSFAEIVFAGEAYTTDGEGNVHLKAPLQPGAYDLSYSDNAHGVSSVQLIVEPRTPPMGGMQARMTTLHIGILPANQRVREPKTNYGVQVKLIDESGYPLAGKAVEVTVDGHTELVSTNRFGVADTYGVTPAAFGEEVVVEAVFKGDRTYSGAYNNASFSTRGYVDGATRTGEVGYEGPDSVPGGTAGGVSVAESASAPPEATTATPDKSGKGALIALGGAALIGGILAARKKRT